MPYYSDPIPYPGIHRLKLPMAGSPLKYINAYLIPAPEGHLLIDTGWNTEDTYIDLMQQLRQNGTDPADIRQIVITHTHVDHYGMAATIKQISNGRLSMHATEDKLARFRYGQADRYVAEYNRILRQSGLTENHIPDPREMIERFGRLVAPVEPDTLFAGGEIIKHGDFQFEVLWAPGHSPGQICLYDPLHKIFFSGDHILPGITPNVGLSPMAGDNPLNEYLTSLNSLQSLEVDLMLPSHGPPVKGFARMIHQTLKQHRKRKDEIIQIMSQHGKPLTPFALVKQMTWYAKGAIAPWETLRAFDQRLAVTEVMAHLEELAGHGLVAKSVREGIRYYGAVQ